MLFWFRKRTVNGEGKLIEVYRVRHDTEKVATEVFSLAHNTEIDWQEVQYRQKKVYTAHKQFVEFTATACGNGR